MEKVLRFVGTVIFTLVFLLHSQLSYSACPIVDRYYSRADGEFLLPTVWSKVSHTSISCGCVPDDDGVCQIVIPSNTAVYIKHNLTSTCNITISNNALLVIDDGGVLTVSGNSSLTGTGNLQINEGGTLNISGDFNLNGDGTGINNGVVNVYGDLTFSGNSSLCGTGVVNVGGTTIGGNPCSTIILPVQLLYFSAIEKNEKVELNWVTASEMNSDYFRIERSMNGLDYYEVGIVDAAGNSELANEYFICDDEPVSGVSYYRLKQIDQDGREKTYDPVPVICNSGKDEIVTFPNPATRGSTLNIGIPGQENESVSVNIYDLTGRLVLTKTIQTKSGTNFISIELIDEIDPGTFFVIVSSVEKSYNTKILVW